MALIQGLAYATLILALADPWTPRTDASIARVAIWTKGGVPAQLREAWRNTATATDSLVELTWDNGAQSGFAAQLRRARHLASAKPRGVVTVGLAANSRSALDELQAELLGFTEAGITLHGCDLDAGETVGSLRPIGIDHLAALLPREPFSLRVHAHSDSATTIDCPWLVQATDETNQTVQLGSGLVQLEPGDTVFELDQTAPLRPGTHSMRIVWGDHESRSAIEIGDPPRIAWLDQRNARDTNTTEQLIAACAASGLEIKRIEVAPSQQQPPGGWNPNLDGFDAIVVDDVPARDLGTAAMDQITERVVDAGAGLLLAGANNNLGPGGFANSSWRDLLPVSMPQREERREPSLAVVLILDTSGSMGGGRIDLAKEIARLALAKLQPHDRAGIVEFFGAKRWAAPLQSAANRVELTRALGRLQPGGGTIIYEALEEAYYALLNAKTKYRHVLVLTDGGVERGAFEALAKRMVDADIALHTVLVGPQGNSPFLMSLAQWGRGRFFAAPSRFRLPDLDFHQPETVPLPAVTTGSWQVLADNPDRSTFAWNAMNARAPGPVTATLVNAQTRPGARALLRAVRVDSSANQSSDSNLLLAAHHIGRGSVHLLTTPLGQPRLMEAADSSLWSHPAGIEFLVDQLRTLSRDSCRDRPNLDVTRFGSSARVRFNAANRTPWPTPRLLVSCGGESLELPMEPAAGGGFMIDVPHDPWLSRLAEAEASNKTDISNDRCLVFACEGARAVLHLDAPVVTGALSPSLQSMVQATGGRWLATNILDAVTDTPLFAPNREAPLREQSLRNLLAMVALGLFFLAVFVRRRA